MANPGSDIGTYLSQIVDEYGANGRVNARPWLELLPEHAEFITDFIAELELQEGVSDASLAEDPWPDTGGAVARVLEAHRNDPFYEEARIGRAVAHARNLARRRPDGRQEFRRAAVYAWAFDVLRGSERQATVYSVGKAVFLLEHALNLGLFDRHQQMAYGPYDPKLKYGGARKIAEQRSWYSATKDGSTLVVGKSIREAASYAERYVKDKETAERLLAYMRRLGFEDLELLSTLLWAATAMLATRIKPTADVVLEWLAQHWPAKTQRPHFTTSAIADGLERLHRLGILS